jgi:hypothetical protein
MRRVFLFITMITISQLILAQTKIFNGTWFDINYPSNFIVKAL